MKKIFVTLMLAAVCCSALSQHQDVLTIDQCYTLARASWPLTRQRDLLARARGYTLANANRSYLPQLTLAARATTQSAVTELPLRIPGIVIESMEREQYQAVAEISQIVWDGSATGAQKKIAAAAYGLEEQKLEVDLYALNERVNNLFFGILLLREQLAQSRILQQELGVNQARIAALAANGMATQSDLDLIRVEQLNVIQRQTEILAAASAFSAMLGGLIGRVVDTLTSFEKPAAPVPADTTLSVQRPELKLFEASGALQDAEKKMVLSRSLPRVGLFLQGGAGKPGLNMLKTEAELFYLGGVRLTWNLAGFYTQVNSMALVGLNKQTIALQKEAFCLNAGLVRTQQSLELEKFKALMASDDSIITLRSAIKKAAEAKVVNGTITVPDLVREINAENLARQARALHEIQYLAALFALKHTLNR